MSIGKQQNTAGLRRFCAAVFYGGAGESQARIRGCAAADYGRKSGPGKGSARPGNGEETGSGRGGRTPEMPGDFIDRKPLSC